jgi:preprotein translocase subunit SecD
MGNRQVIWIIIGILLVVGIAINLNITGNNTFLGTDTHMREGLDLLGGLQVLLEADLPAGQDPSPQMLEVAGKIIKQRVDALGVSEPIVQVSQPRRIVVELPGYEDPDAAIALIRNTALLEFIAVPDALNEGTLVQTDYLGGNTNKTGTGLTQSKPTEGQIIASGPTAASPLSASLAATAAPALPLPTSILSTAAAPTGTPTIAPATTVYHTLMTGAMLTNASVGRNNANIIVNINFNDEGSKIFSEYTTNHVGGFVAIILDKKVISCPRINTAITGGSGYIEGKFTQEAANQLAIQLSYGSLPVPLKVVRTQEVGPTLGQDSLRRSMIAGIIGLLAVVLFMLFYYRLPGILADLALTLYAITTFTVYRLVPVTFTLPGIAGFILSVGMAVDANILIFERMKEELRAGRSLRDAVEIGFSRAWSSIRDSNLSTLITCFVLFIFGNAFGASIVKGFALTLAIGVLISMFTAILVTRNLLHLILDRIDFTKRHSWFGL